MSKEEINIDQSNGADSIDKAQAEDLARQLADAKRQELIAQHRLNEVESGRIFRSIRFLKKSIVNPLWAVRNIKEFAGLFRKIPVAPLPDSTPTADDYLEKDGLITLPTSLVNAPRSLKYPNIKIASLGSPEIFSKVAHVFDVQKTDWAELLKLGVDFLLITDHELAKSQYGEDVIAKFRRSDGGRALVDKHTTLLWWVTEKKQLESSMISDIDTVLLASEEVYDIKSGANSLNIYPSVDFEVHNPINWLNRPESGLIAIGNKTSRETASLAQKISAGYAKEDYLVTEKHPSDQLFKRAKKARAVLCRSEDFMNEDLFNQTIVRLAASGVPLITNGSKTLKRVLPEAFKYADNKKDASTVYEQYENDEFREKFSITVRQHILGNHSHLSRFEEILDSLGLARNPEEKISIIMSTMRQKEVEHGLNSVAIQKWQNKELILILHRIKEADFDTKRIRSLIKKYKLNVTILDRGKNSVFGENLNLALEQASGKYVTKMDDDDFYGPNHLYDLHLAYHYSKALAVGKWGNFVYLTGRDEMVDFVIHREERFVRHLPGATVFMRRSDLRDLKFGRVTRAIDSELYRRAEMRGGRLYSTHRYNFIRVRHTDHTYTQDEEDFIANASSKPRSGLDKDACFI